MLLKNSNYLLNEGYHLNNDIIHKGKGSKIFINNKEILDLSFCAGSLILGHSSKIFKKSLNEIVNKNISNFASKNLYAVKFAETLKKLFPKYDKFVFCNSGTEAIFKSLRLTRAITKKNLIISVSGSWHGSVNELLFTPNKNLKNTDLSAGLKSSDKKNIKFIPYNDIEKSKKILDKYKKKIMCIIIEPIQGCLPISAKKYLNFLNDYSKKNKLILIFDEMITGMRVNMSSVQDEMNLSPSISTFGKCFGGGMPIGIIAVKKQIYTKLSKANKKVFFGGTFSGNSLSTYVGDRVSNYIYQNKNKIFKDLENKSSFLQKEINDFLFKGKYDAKVYRYHSMLRIVFSKKNIKNRYQRDFLENKHNKKINLFKKVLLEKKIYIPSSGVIFVSASTTYKDLNFLIKNIKKTFTLVF